jgi:hypothetical protein
MKLKSNPSKADEIGFLNKFIASLPEGSYLADWMKHAAPFVASDIRNDIFPSLVPSDARKEADEIIAAAKERADFLVKSAEFRAMGIVADAEKEVAVKYDRFNRAKIEAERAAASFMEKMSKF